MVRKLLEYFMKNNCKKTNQEEFRKEKVIKDINVKVDLSNYATKTDLKNVSHVNVSRSNLKSNQILLV